ncbi:RHS repeat-associated protein [Luteimicrobium subarcticum]|uniref:RHS repeat-associated protein n=1 Tax=Luteimicrobium subarcticum TaxID=620910 RepID=A0A2M8WW96_9MICO|nr:RHS repeat-associated protein [Luteimicrobium subarcticum]
MSVTAYCAVVSAGREQARAAVDGPTTSGHAADYQCFSYDGLRRLTQAWTPRTADCGVSGRTASNLGGAAPCWSSYGYDVVGNRASVVGHGTDGSTTTSVYSYDGSGGAGPHAVTRVATTSSAVGVAQVDSAFAYDKTGNMVSRAVGGTDAQTLAWDAGGRLAGVATTSSGVSQGLFVYSADGDRLLRRQGGTVTAYLPGGQELTLTTATSTLAATRYYTVGGQTIAVRTGSGPSGVTTLVPDAQGTAQYAVTDTTNQLTVRHQDPFGVPRGQGGTFPGDHGFLDKPADATGLTQVGARYYDPALGRFVSVDPVMDLGDPQQWAAYSYANNNPTTWTDPTGLAPIGMTLPDGRHGGTHSDTSTGSTTTSSSTSTSTPDGPPTTTSRSTIWWATPDGIGGAIGDWVSTHQEIVKEVAPNTIPGYSQYQFTSRTYTAFQAGDFSQWGGFMGWNEELKFQVGITALDLTGVGEGVSLLAAPARAGLKTTAEASVEGAGADATLSAAGSPARLTLPELRAAADATVPSGLTRAQWGKMVWGAGGGGGAAATNARALIGRSAEQLGQIPGLNVSSATAWRDFYRQAVEDGRGVANPANATNQARVELLNDIIVNLGG